MKHAPALLLLTLSLAACTPSAPPGQSSGTPTTPKASIQTYTDDDQGYSIDVPSDWTIAKDDTLVTENYQVTGTSFAYPADRDRSALFDAKVHIASVPTCPDLEGTMEDINATKFTRTEWDGVGAGNRYQGETYTLARDKDCLVITLYTHSCNLGGSDCGDDHALPFSYDDTLFKLRWTLETFKLL